MRKKLTAAHAAAWLLGGATLAVAGVAAADACPVNATTVYVSGSSAFAPVYQPLVNALGGAIQIVGFAPGSCEGLDDVLKATPRTDTTATLYMANVASTSCTNTSSTIDIGASDVYLDTCTAFDTSLPSAVPAGFADNLGPIQAMTIAVPFNSSAQMISAEAAKMVFGFDAAAGMAISPWTDSNTILVRFFDSGTLEMIGKAINLPGPKWKNASVKASAGSPVQQATSGGNMASLLAGFNTMAASMSTAVGILATSNLAAAAASTIKPLAFQGTGQTCSYLPDSQSSTNDKINVRQGRYQIWGPEHLITKVDSTSGKPVGTNGNNTAVQAVINALTSSSQALPSSSDAGVGDAGITTTLTEDQVATIIAGFAKPSVGFIPQCAMQVKRTEEIGAEASFGPPSACGCFYEQQTTVVSGTCDSCTVDSDCKKPAATHCHFHYCEAE
jgi:hypothetical protein